MPGEPLQLAEERGIGFFLKSNRAEEKGARISKEEFKPLESVEQIYCLAYLRRMSDHEVVMKS